MDIDAHSRKGLHAEPVEARDRTVLLHDDLRRAAPRCGILARELLPDAIGDGAVDLGVRAVGVADDDWMAAVRCLADLDVERDLAEKLDAELGRLLARAAMAEDVALMAAFRTLEVTHVLDDADRKSTRLNSSN